MRKVWRQLRREGLDVARCTVTRLMRPMGLKVRAAVMNGTLVSEHTAAEPFARRPFRRAA
ncbi:hypothetical protein GCM10022293_49230 [Azospirillum formosense]